MQSRELERARALVGGTAPALRGGAPGGTAPALRGGASLPKGRSTALVIGIGMLAMLAIAVGLRLVERGELLAHRVVVSARGCGPECASLLERALAESLSRLGFDASAPLGRAPERFSGPEAARAFARSHGARFAVMLMVVIEDSSALAQGKGQRAMANATLYVMDAARSDPPRPLYTLRGVDEGDDERTALTLISRRFVQGLSPVAASWLLASESVKALQRSTTGLPQQAAALAFRKHQRDLEARTQAMREYERDCSANDAALELADADRCVSPSCATEYAVGMLADGGAAVVHDSTALANFPLDPNSTPRRLLTSERLWLVPRRGARTLLAEAANFAARPDLSRDGRVLAFIEQRFGQQRLYALELASLTRRLIDSVEAPRRIGTPHISPDGSRILYYAFDDDRASPALLLARNDDNAHPQRVAAHAIDASWVRLALPASNQPRPLIAALVPSDTAERTSLVVFDPENAAAVAREALDEHAVRSIGQVYADAGELLLSWADDDACGFARYRPGHAVEWTATDACPEHIAVGPHEIVADALIGDAPHVRQLVRIDAHAGRLAQLTKGVLGAERPKPAANGAGLIYERPLPRKYGELPHVAVCFGP